MIENLCKSDKVCIQSRTVNPGVASIGGDLAIWTSDANTTPCRVSSPTAKEIEFYQALGQRIAFKVCFSSDKSLTNNNRLHWISSQSQAISRYLRVEAYYERNSPFMDSDMRLFVAMCSEETI